MFGGNGVGVGGVEGPQPLLDRVQRSGSVQEGRLRVARARRRIGGPRGGGAYGPLGPREVQRGHRVVEGYGATAHLARSQGKQVWKATMMCQKVCNRKLWMSDDNRPGIQRILAPLADGLSLGALVL